MFGLKEVGGGLVGFPKVYLMLKKLYFEMIVGWSRLAVGLPWLI